MIFSLKNIFIALLLFITAVAGIVVYISTSVFYQNSQDHVVQEKRIAIQSTGRLIFSEDGSRDLSTEPLAAIHDILSIHAKERGVVFFRLVDLENRTIVASSVDGENGKRFENIPAIKIGEVVVNGTTEEKAAVELTYQANAKYALWLAVDKVFLTGPTLAVTVQQVFLMLVMILMISLALWTLGMGFVVRPVRQLQESLVDVGEERFSVRLPEGPPNEFGALFSAFNVMVERIQTARERDRLVSKLKSDFISTAAHQLRTPLTGMRWALTNFISGDYGLIKAEQKNILETILSKTVELINIIGTLLNVASIEEGKFGFEFRRASLIDEVKKTVQGLLIVAKNNQVKLELADDIEKNLPLIRMDPEKIQWVLRNILDNALRYTLPGGSVRVSVKREGDNFVLVSVQDTGIGMAADEKERIFEKFFRGKRALHVRTDGNGLGLYIAKNIIDRHQGTIGFESEEGKGSVFHFTLPIDPLQISKDEGVL